MSTTSAYTLEQWIFQYREEANTLDTFLLSQAISDGKTTKIFTDASVLSKYRVELEEYKTSTDLSPDQLHFYSFNPRLLAYELYKIPELWYLILYANEMHTASQFCRRHIKFYTPGVIRVLNSIREIELDRLNANAQSLTNVTSYKAPVTLTGRIHISV